MRLLPLALIILAAVLLRLPAFFQPPWYMDEGIFASVAHAWGQGEALYTGAWDNKPPGIFAVYRLGWLTGLEMTAVRLLDLGAMLATIALVYVMAVRTTGRTGGVVAAAVAGILLGLPTIEAHIANTESFFIPFTALGMYLVLRGIETERREAWLLAAGLTFGLACLFKQVAVFDIAAAGAFLLLVFRSSGLRPGVFLASGVAAVVLVVVVLFGLFGSIGDLWFATVESLTGYRQDSTDSGFERYLVALVPMLIAVPYVVWLRPWQTRSPEALPVLWLAFTALAVSASGRSYPHYLLHMTPPFAVVAGLMVSPLQPRLPRFGMAAGLVLASVLLVHVILGPLPNLAWNREPEFTRGYYANFLDYALGRTDRQSYETFFDRRAFAHLGLYEQLEAGLRDREVFVWGDVPWLYAEAGLINPTPYATLFHVVEVEGDMQSAARLISAVQPDHVLVMEEARDSWESVQGILGDQYVEEQQFLASVLYVRR